MKEMMKEATESVPEQIKGTTPSHKLEDYTGTFEHPAYGTLQVYKRELLMSNSVADHGRGLAILQKEGILKIKDGVDPVKATQKILRITRKT